MFILMGPTAFATPPPLRWPLLLFPSIFTREAVVPPSANAAPVDKNLLRDADAEDGEEGGGTIGSGQDRDDGERAVMCNPVAVTRYPCTARGDADDAIIRARVMDG